MPTGTVMGKSTEDISAFLERLKKRKLLTGQIDASGDPTKPDWQDSVPSTLSYQKPADTGILGRMQDEIANTDAENTNTALVQADNQKNKNLFEQQQQLAATARQSYIKRLNEAQIKQKADQSGTNGFTSVGGSSGSTSGGKGASTTNFSGSSPAPKGLTTINSHGHNVTVNSAVAGRFKGFLDALWSSGYHFKSVGGYANRNIASGPAAGTRRSAHSYGYAIDIDPGSNPTYSIQKHYVYALPPSVGALAAKYGLHWGGNWRTYKDFMHFSVPINGVE